MPSKVWKWLAVILIVGGLLIGGYLWHGHKIKVMKANAYAEGYQAAVDAGKRTNVIVNQGSAQISNKNRSEFNAKLADNVRRADALRLSGPGKAKATACVHPQLSSSPSGQVAGSGDIGPGVVGVPDQERDGVIALPFGETVDRGEVNDANRLEAKTWRKWHDELTVWWDKVRAEAEKSQEK